VWKSKELKKHYGGQERIVSSVLEAVSCASDSPFNAFLHLRPGTSQNPPPPPPPAGRRTLTLRPSTVSSLAYQLVAKDAARLVIEEGEAVLYHIMDNDRYAHMGAEDDDGNPVDEEAADAAAREEGRGVMVRCFLPPSCPSAEGAQSECQQVAVHSPRPAPSRESSKQAATSCRTAARLRSFMMGSGKGPCDELRWAAKRCLYTHGGGGITHLLM
jgi:hypothetical protein